VQHVAHTQVDSWFGLGRTSLNGRLADDTRVYANVVRRRAKHAGLAPVGAQDLRPAAIYARRIPLAVILRTPPPWHMPVAHARRDKFSMGESHLRSDKLADKGHSVG
jgi:hypothetical protein